MGIDLTTLSSVREKHEGKSFPFFGTSLTCKRTLKLLKTKIIYEISPDEVLY